MLKVNNLKISTAAECILQPVSFEWNLGDHILLFGANGSGKTTLVETLIGLNRTGLKVTGEINLRVKNIGYLPQRIEYPLKFPITVDELWDLTISNLLEINKDLDKQIIIKNKEDLVASFNIKNISKKKIGRLSGGQLQKVKIVQAMIGDPDMLILDEPTNNLDQASVLTLKEIIKTKLKNKSSLVVQISHDHNLDEIYPDAEKLEIINHKLQEHIHGNS